MWKKGDAYWDAVRRVAKDLNSDGCSGPTLQVYVDACYEHDIAYRTHKTLVLDPASGTYVLGAPITQLEADQRFRDRIREMSVLDGFSPMALWRYAVLRLFGDTAWNDGSRGTPLAENPRLYRWPDCRKPTQSA